MKKFILPTGATFKKGNIYSIGFSWSSIDFIKLKKVFLQENVNLMECQFHIYDKNFPKVKKKLLEYGVLDNLIYEINST